MENRTDYILTIIALVIMLIWLLFKYRDSRIELRDALQYHLETKHDYDKALDNHIETLESYKIDMDKCAQLSLEHEQCN